MIDNFTMTELHHVKKNLKSLNDLIINLDQVLFSFTSIRNELQESASLLQLRKKELELEGLSLTTINTVQTVRAEGESGIPQA